MISAWWQAAAAQSATQAAGDASASASVPPAALEAATDLLPRASTFAAPVDDSFTLIAWFAVFLVIVIAGVFGLILLRSTSRSGTAAPLPRSLVPCTALGALALAAVIFVQGANVRADMLAAPRGAFPIRVALEERGWSFTYPNGYVSNELHLPVDRAVKLFLRAAAEPCTFAVPAFRLQVSVASGEQREAWVQATLPGEYVVRSNAPTTRAAESSQSAATVHAAGGFEKWYRDVSGPPLDLPPLELGARSFQMRGCTQCHTLDGAKLIGPSLKGFSAREHRMQDGSVVTASEAYVRESLLDPQAKVVEGFDPVMPTFRGRLHELEIVGLSLYIQSLQ
jgi:cytochrome c oxidase subunit II